VTATASYTYLSPIDYPPEFAAFTKTKTTVKDNYALVGRVSIPLSDYVLKLSDASAAAKAGSEAARYALRAQELALDRDARTLYFTWLRFLGGVEIGEKAVERTRARLEDAKASFTVGTISKGELLRIEAQLANTETALESARSNAALAHGQLGVLMQDPNPKYTVGEGIPDPSTVPTNEERIADLVLEAHSRRMEVKSLEQSVKLYRSGASATRANALPRIDATGDVTYASPNQRYFPQTADFHFTYSAGIAASWTVFDTAIQSSVARELDANAEATEARRLEIKNAIANEVQSAWLDLGRTRENFGHQQVALAAAEEAYRVTTELFRAGRATGTDLIESENQLLFAKLGEIETRINLVVASINLRHATGRDIPAKQ
jgi:outer membrane protein TolC